MHYFIKAFMVKNITVINCVALFCFPFVVYIHNLSPGVYGGDSGDYLSAALLQGVAHPSGYPLYTLVGILLTSLPFEATPAWKFGLGSAFFSAAGVCVFYLLSHALTKSKLASFLASLALAFTYPYWLFAEVVEMTSLHIFFLLGTLYLLSKYLSSQKTTYLYILAFFFGLSLTNNLSSVLLIPSIVFSILLTTHGQILKQISTLGKSASAFLVGLTPYIYIPIAAQNQTAFNWGFALTLKNFIYLVLRKDYGWAPSATTLSNNSLAHLYSNLFITYLDYWRLYINFFFIGVMVLGVGYLLTHKKKLELIIFFSAFVLFGPLFVLYTSTPISSFLTVAVFEKFYIASIVIAFLFIPYGLMMLKVVLSKTRILQTQTKKVLINIVFFGFLAIICSTFLTNYPKLNFRHVYIGDNFAQSILDPLPKNSMLLLTSDTMSFNALYLQNAYAYRTDVYIPGLQDGFVKHFSKYSGLSDTDLRESLIAKRGAVAKDMLFASIAPALADGVPIFSDTEFELIDNQHGRIVSIPYGLLYKLSFEDQANMSQEDYVNSVNHFLSQLKTTDIQDHPVILQNNLIYADIQKLYSIAYFRVADYVAESYQDLDSAKMYVKKSIELEPESN